MSASTAPGFYNSMSGAVERPEPSPVEDLDAFLLADLVRAVRYATNLTDERDRIAAAIEAHVLTDTLGDELYHVHNDALRLAAWIARHSHDADTYQ